MSDLQVIISTLENKVKALEGALSDRGDAGMMSGWIPGGGGGGIDYSVFLFGFSVSGAEVTVSPGESVHGTRGTILTASKVLEIATDYAYIYGKYTFGSGVVTIEQKATRPINEENVFVQIFYQWRLIDGKASIHRIHHLGQITIQGSFA